MAPVASSMAFSVWAAIVSGRAMFLDMLAAIDVKLGARHIARGLGAEEIDRLRHFLGLAQAMHRELGDDPLGAGLEDRGFDLARRDGIDAHAERTKIGGHLARKSSERRFRS